MACILKFPDFNSRGVIIFTTPERDSIILPSVENVKVLEKLKENWIVGLHHNWHDYNFIYNPLFDFSMAGEEDLIEANGVKFPLIPLDACNFSPAPFYPSQVQKNWDILYVARAVFFKKIPNFFETIKEIYRRGKKYRVLFLCPIPDFNKADIGSVFYDIEKEYNLIFSAEEKKLFNLLTFRYSYPFPMDMETLGFFYRSSKIFVHSADDERRCRVAGYAWSSGLPVVAMSCVGSLLPSHSRKEPYFYSVSDYAFFPDQIEKALNELEKSNSPNAALDEFIQDNAINKLVFCLHNYFTDLPILSENYYTKNLDLRLGRSYGASIGPNRIGDNFIGFLDYLINQRNNFNPTIKLLDDPEKAIANIVEVKLENQNMIGQSNVKNLKLSFKDILSKLSKL